MMTRRTVSKLFLLPQLQAQRPDPGDLPGQLGLNGADAQRLEREGARAREQARWLEDLPLDDAAPGFVFFPR